MCEFCLLRMMCLLVTNSIKFCQCMHWQKGSFPGWGANFGKSERSETRPGESCVENERAEGDSVSVPVYCERSDKPVDPPIIQDKVRMG